MLPMGFGHVEGVAHDYKRHGTSTLFAAINVLSGAVLAQCKPRHRRQEFLAFLHSIDNGCARRAGRALHRGQLRQPQAPKAKAWLAVRPRWHMHFIPTYSSWLNRVERFFSIITNKVIRRGSFTSVKELIDKIDHRRSLQPDMQTLHLDRLCRLHPCQARQTLLAN